MPSPEPAILRALRSHLIDFARHRTLPIAFTNRQFTAPSGVYLRETLIPNQTGRLFVASDGPHRHMGLYQVDVFAPENTGETDHVALAGEIADHFAVDLRLTDGGVRTRITKRPSVGPTLVDGALAMIPTTIEWETFA
ncbi:phage tail terminator-like protein [Fulvimarina sp. 2208YS6-2-32]|uniref:Phage tail terminator-like protein n=1 Tax=Fulvimarina uroteuthidis TaxID=3098149 RepID=A0ABU5HYQ4_9HYPH|nr:phage tail terminator-like protein [Fulvimarina sp. 2208YS6-2-32]MDY8108256.1 phage tail terminator-like protein [Fulvimarina sp. 2208YS6-2-32]